MFSDYATADALLLHNVRHDCVNTSCGLDNDCLTSHTIHLRCVWSVLNEMHNCRRKSVTIWLGIYFGILIFRMLCWITDLRTLSCSIAKREKLYSVEGTYTISARCFFTSYILSSNGSDIFFVVHNFYPLVFLRSS